MIFAIVVIIDINMKTVLVGVGCLMMFAMVLSHV